MRTFVQINEKDNVIIALTDLPSGEVLTINGKSITLVDDVKQGHKIAVSPISQGENVIKYGFPIGRATTTIQAGQHVHVHNVETNLNAQLDYRYEPKLKAQVEALKEQEINVYHRANGAIGIRNELWIIPTVGCINKVAKHVRNQFLAEVGKIENLDGVFVFEHPYGCAQKGDDYETTRKILQNLVLHPNAGGVLVIGLGCEDNQVAEFKATLGEYDENRIRFMIAQNHDDEIEAGKQLVQEIYQIAKQDVRKPAPLSTLRVGLECGGSDGFSGITANPLLGDFSGYLIANGGTTVLTEVPEMFGAETILMDRCINKDVFEKTVHLINDFKQYCEDNDLTGFDQPSPGNKEGGITTLEDKSLGCTQKAGTSNVVDVLAYTDRLSKSGLNLLQAPGNDLVATTALGTCGSHMVLFTTGRGTPYGRFIPTVKISSNTALFNRKPHWIDFDAGQLLESTREEVLADFIAYIIRVANGEWTHNETNDYREIAIWKFGVTL